MCPNNGLATRRTPRYTGQSQWTNPYLFGGVLMIDSGPDIDIDVTLFREGLDRVSTAAELLGVSRAQVYVFMDECGLPYVKFRRSRRIPRRALLEFAARHLASGTFNNPVSGKE